jgi:(2R)-3-sulfolactate dehydrogenase (NADP+)
MTLLTLDEIEMLTFGALTRAGASEHQARPVARSIRRAEADDIRPVGLGFLSLYLAHLRSGKVDGKASPAMSTPCPATVSVDAAHGFAHPAFDLGLDALDKAARACGVASMAITRSYSIGVLGHPAEDIALRGLLAIVVSNAPPNMTAWGGRRKIFGTNPIAFAIPRENAPPLVVDQATTMVTRVALVAAAAEGRAIPDSWAFDANGLPTTDPAAALKGSMAPAGGAKGANIALLVEVLAAALAGADLSMDVHPYGIADGPPPGVGQLVLVFDPNGFAPGFSDRIEKLLGAIAADGARIPGNRRLAARFRSARDGVEVDDALLAQIEAEG